MEYVSSNRKKTNTRTKSLSLKPTGVNAPERIPLGRRTNFQDIIEIKKKKK